MTEHLNMARLVKPFPTRKLDQALHAPLATSALLDKRLHALLADPPTLPEKWCLELQQIKGLLLCLRDECGEVEIVIDELFDRADQDFDSSVRAVQSMLRGWAAEPPVTEEEEAEWRRREAA